MDSIDKAESFDDTNNGSRNDGGIPTMLCLQDITNDDDYYKFSSSSDIDITRTASLKTSDTNLAAQILAVPSPPPEPLARAKYLQN